MASYSTPNYSLPQWEMDDRILMEDFNEAMHNIDEALSLKAQVIIGSYEGDGSAERTITLGKTPKAVLVADNRATMGFPLTGSITAYGGLALLNAPVTYTGLKALEIVEGGFKVFCAKNSNFIAATNDSNYTYNYIAFY